MRKIFAGIAAAALTAGLSVSAHAETKPGTPAPIAGSETREPISTDRKYCVKQTPTGTRLSRTACKTRAEWLDLGFDPLDAK